MPSISGPPGVLVPTKLIIHSSATRDSGSVSWDAIRDYHINHNGWSDIGYHYGIEIVGNNIALMYGRSPCVVGAHCKAGGRNRDSLGLCVVGDYDNDPPQRLVYWAVVEVAAMICDVFNIDPLNVYGHREFEDGKTCPGRMFDLHRLRDDISSYVKEIDGGIKIIYEINGDEDGIYL